MAEILVIPAKIPTLVRIPKCRLMGSTPFCFLQKASRFMWLACFVSLCDIIQYIYVVIWFVLKLKFCKNNFRRFCFYYFFLCYCVKHFTHA